jgi:hypothetical protein
MIFTRSVRRIIYTIFWILVLLYVVCLIIPSTRQRALSNIWNFTGGIALFFLIRFLFTDYPGAQPDPLWWPLQIDRHIVSSERSWDRTTGRPIDGHFGGRRR